MKDGVGKVLDEKPSSPESHSLMSKYDLKSEINFEDVMSSLSGFARVVKYRSVPTPGAHVNPRLMDKKELEVLSIEEGLFKNGKKSGYCRVFNGETGQAQCGFYKNDLPSGKFVRWGDDEIEIEEGIFKGKSIAKSIGIKSFIFNVETNY